MKTHDMSSVLNFLLTWSKHFGFYRFVLSNMDTCTHQNVLTDSYLMRWVDPHYKSIYGGTSRQVVQLVLAIAHITCLTYISKVSGVFFLPPVGQVAVVIVYPLFVLCLLYSPSLILISLE